MNESDQHPKNLHEAVSVIPEQGKKPETVVTEDQKEWVLGNLITKFSMVLLDGQIRRLGRQVLRLPKNDFKEFDNRRIQIRREKIKFEEECASFSSYGKYFTIVWAIGVLAAGLFFSPDLRNVHWVLAILGSIIVALVVLLFPMWFVNHRIYWGPREDAKRIWENEKKRLDAECEAILKRSHPEVKLQDLRRYIILPFALQPVKSVKQISE